MIIYEYLLNYVLICISVSSANIHKANKSSLNLLNLWRWLVWNDLVKFTVTCPCRSWSKMASPIAGVHLVCSNPSWITRIQTNHSLEVTIPYLPYERLRAHTSAHAYTRTLFVSNASRQHTCWKETCISSGLTSPEVTSPEVTSPAAASSSAVTSFCTLAGRA